MNWPASGMTDAQSVLRAAVGEIHGDARPGQQRMVEVLSESLESGVHLLVQAGTGTGKSLGYLAPALAHVVDTGERVVIATATLALQAQLANKDIPAALDAVEEVTGVRPKAAVMKGRTNYACLYRSRGGVDPGQAALIGAGEFGSAPVAADDTSKLGLEVLALREWVEQEVQDGGLGDRDDAPSHTARGWAQVSIPNRECLGVNACPFGEQCLVEASRDRARKADLVVTNHALLAFDAMQNRTILPEHGAVIIDEAHELVSRITTAATDELTQGIVDRTARRAMEWLDDDLGHDFLTAAEELGIALGESEPGRVTSGTAPVVYAASVVRDVSRRVATALGGNKDTDADRTQALGAVREVYDVAERIAALADADVVWITDSEIAGKAVYVAPLDVSGLLRTSVFGETTAVLTSATLALGGSFEPVAAQVGLRRSERVEEVEDPPEFAWRAFDVGSPFDYRRQGILYAATRLPNPGRDGLTKETLAEVAQLVWAADGRTLGLFASRRAAEQAADHCRRELPGFTILCQGDAQLPELTRRFQEDPRACLFGTMSLWQGVDVPGDTCQLVLIDKIPFPRPDDPLMQARKKAVDDAGGNGFMQVAATHAALLLAQGSGRLIRRADDRGVVAVLDPRLMKARYGSFLRSSLPDFWLTTDGDVAVHALRRLRGEE
ncbi:ATP-dependent DNA helicase [Tessaracoccus caeni]|uniref:ATP-dependent DNA helicase n=1 Tax=Tessaracoccus caeni TaxID=3031239 RepID=UPI0023DA9619|nr:ATP-dependent DNA helicase [Tessaracoccus caeni]MDF1487932.1 ATP-dependent DNA helicase [Tessaracoccus caeni]